MADPGFPVGWVADFRAGYVPNILYVNAKESGPLRGRAPAVPPRSANADIWPPIATYVCVHALPVWHVGVYVCVCMCG